MKHVVILLLGVSLWSCSRLSPPNDQADDQAIRSPRYFDAILGSNDNDGTTELTAWKDLDTINTLTWGPGAELLLKAGCSWTASLSLSGSGNVDQPILLGKYGEGPSPVINGPGYGHTIRLKNQEFWVLSDLEITNYDSVSEGMSLEEWEAYNRSYWSEGEVKDPLSVARTNRYGILVAATDFGPVRHLHFNKLEVHGVNGNITSKDNGGIFLEITGSYKPTWFVDIKFEDCYIHDVDRTGISNQSSWSVRSLESNTSWKPSEEVVFRNNRFERTGANALIVRVARSPVMEYNLFDHCAIKESGNASFSFNCDNALWQYNEARYTRYNTGDVDAGGFDSDYRCKNTVIRYNYSHDNDFGAILVCCDGGDTRFNVGTLVCYNLFVNNRNHAIRVSGIPAQTLFLNNVIYQSGDAAGAEVIWHKNWNGYPDQTTYANNIFYSEGGSAAIDLGSSTGNVFEHNLFFGSFTGDIPAGQLSDNPQFTGSDGDGPEGFMLKGSSPAIDAGSVFSQQPEKDFFGNPVKNGTPPDIGIHEIN